MGAGTNETLLRLEAKMTTLPLNIPELVALATKATQGKWRDLPCPQWARGQHMIRNDGLEWGCFGEIAQAGPEDAAFIAAASPAVILALCERVQRAEGLLERAERALAALQQPGEVQNG